MRVIYALAIVQCLFCFTETKSSEKIQTTHTQRNYTRVSADDDEIHDEEILKAVQTSLYEFYSKKNTTTTSNRVKRGIKMVCYGELGCFRDEGVFDYLDMVPAPPEEINTKFLVYNRESNEPEVYSWDNYTTTAAGRFNSSRPTKIIVHGFGSTCHRMWASEMRQALMAVEQCNVICVDWEAGAALPNYVRAAVNTRLVGKQLSLFINSLNNVHGGKNEDFHLIGFSLGAHVAGFAGSELKNLSRITGLDPAGPLFESYDPKVRLDAGDAMFVDVIHSNGDSLLMGGLGSWEQIGHLDFYPNGGRAQKGCSHMFLGAFRDLIWSAPTATSSSHHHAAPPPPPPSSTSPPMKKMRMRMLPLDALQPPPPPPPSSPSPPPPPPPPPPEADGRSLCNHRRAYKFFTESVSPRCQFPAFFCDSFDKYMTGTCFHGVTGVNTLYYNMGYYADVGWASQPQPQQQQQGSDKQTTKLLYTATRDNEPFCANQFRIRVESSPSPAPISTYGGLEAILVGSSSSSHMDAIADGGGELVNNTFLVTQTPKDNMVAGSVLQRLVVAHPALQTPIKVILKYSAYQGWLYSGISRWSMDRIIITDARGASASFCTRGLLLPSGISVTIQLTPGICTNHPSSTPVQPPPPNYPNYPYETYTPNPNLANLSKLIIISNSSMDYSEWQPINSSSETLSTNNITEAAAAGGPQQHHHHNHHHGHAPHHHAHAQQQQRGSYVTKHVIPNDIDNILREHEVTGPAAGGSVPTRLLLGTTRSLKSRPIVLRNRVMREGRGMDGGGGSMMYLIPSRRYSKGASSSSSSKHTSNNNEPMRQVGIKMMMEGGGGSRDGGVVSELLLGDVVSLPSSPMYKRNKQFGLVALRRRRKKKQRV